MNTSHTIAKRQSTSDWRVSLYSSQSRTPVNIESGRILLFCIPKHLWFFCLNFIIARTGLYRLLFCKVQFKYRRVGELHLMKSLKNSCPILRTYSFCVRIESYRHSTCISHLSHSQIQITQRNHFLHQMGCKSTLNLLFGFALHLDIIFWNTLPSSILQTGIVELPITSRLLPFPQSGIPAKAPVINWIIKLAADKPIPNITLDKSFTAFSSKIKHCKERICTIVCTPEIHCIYYVSLHLQL